MANKLTAQLATKALWISYDLGLKGDYTGFYTFLDTFGAKECGDSFAFFNFYDVIDIKKEIKSEILKYAKISPNDRVYIIWKDYESGKVKGNYIFGTRKRAPWEGYSNGMETSDEGEL